MWDGLGLRRRVVASGTPEWAGVIDDADTSSRCHLSPSCWVDD
jgi:hypothetical protein